MAHLGPARQPGKLGKNALGTDNEGEQVGTTEKLLEPPLAKPNEADSYVPGVPRKEEKYPRRLIHNGREV